MIATDGNHAALLREVNGTGHWLMTEDGLNQFVAQLQRAAGTQTAKIEVAKPTRPVLTVVGDEAVIPIKGVLLASVPWYFSYLGIDATAYSDIQTQLAEAEGDTRVKTTRLAVDSPGGTVAGVSETAAAIAATGKPTRAVVGGMAASAAYWLASQADEIVAVDPNGAIGSIGVFTVYYDVSARFETEGFKAVLIRSGVHKGMGVMGAPITDEQIAAVQEEIDQIHTHFVDAVAAGRGLDESTVRELATGRTWLAPQARELKLIDAVRVATSTTAGASVSAHTEIGDPEMDTEKDQQAEAQSVAVKAAQSAERQRMTSLRDAFPKDAQFAMEQFAAGATLIEAKAAYADVLGERLDQAEQAAEQKQTDAAAPAGTDATIGASEGEGNAAAAAKPDFIAVSKAYAAEHKCSMTQAMLAVRRQDKGCHDQFLQGCVEQARPREGQCERVTA